NLLAVHRNKTAVNIGREQRVKEFGQDKFYAEGGLLWCNTCNELVDHVRCQTITYHLGAKKAQIEAFMAANIPLEKVDNPTMHSFMQKNLKGGGGIPQANTLRELYVTRIFNQQQANIIVKIMEFLV
uniref:Uncharacterized protein n=1 Tax=Erpetoichthys calabaricus TaxID=27687 RepID=A0A8C4RTC6_ERPCA